MITLVDLIVVVVLPPSTPTSASKDTHNYAIDDDFKTVIILADFEDFSIEGFNYAGRKRLLELI